MYHYIESGLSNIYLKNGFTVEQIDGEEYTKQFYPPNLPNLEFTPHSLIAEMD